MALTTYRFTWAGPPASAVSKLSGPTTLVAASSMPVDYNTDSANLQDLIDALASFGLTFVSTAPATTPAQQVTASLPDAAVGQRGLLAPCNFAATSNPLVSSDSSSGYSVGSRWVNVTTQEEFVCLSASIGAAVWKSTTVDLTGGGGGSTVAGSAVINFGAAPGAQNASVVVSGQAGIAAGSKIAVSIVAVATATHNADEHTMCPARFTPGALIPGTGFTIFAVSEHSLTGTFNLNWFYT